MGDVEGGRAAVVRSGERGCCCWEGTDGCAVDENCDGLVAPMGGRRGLLPTAAAGRTRGG